MIAFGRDGAIWTATLNRPQKANALNRDMLLDLAAFLKDAARADIGALVLTGEGAVFSAGGDLSQMGSGLATDPVWEDVSERLAGLSCLTIAALNGTMAGGAFGPALACDLRVTVAGAEFFYPVMRRGYLPQPSDPVRMAALIGPARAKMILLAGQRIGAAEALSWGLVDRIVEHDALGAARAMCTDALSAGPGHVRAIKSMIP